MLTPFKKLVTSDGYASLCICNCFYASRANSGK